MRWWYRPHNATTSRSAHTTYIRLRCNIRWTQQHSNRQSEEEVLRRHRLFSQSFLSTMRQSEKLDLTCEADSGEEQRGGEEGVRVSSCPLLSLPSSAVVPVLALRGEERTATQHFFNSVRGFVAFLTSHLHRNTALLHYLPSHTTTTHTVKDHCLDPASATNCPVQCRR